MEKRTACFQEREKVEKKPAAPLPEELFLRINLLLKLRLASSLFLAALVVYLLAAFREADFQVIMLLALFCMTLLFNFALHIDLRRQQAVCTRLRLERSVSLQFYFDVMFYLAFVYLTGGINSPFLILMVFPAASAALIFAPPSNYCRLGLVLFLFGLLLFMQVSIKIFPPLMITASLEERSVFSFAGLACAAGLLSYLLMGLIRNLRDNIENLVRMHASLKSNYFETVMALARAVEAKHPGIKHHIENSVRYAELIGGQLNLSEEKMECLKFGVVLHDIGKLAVDEAILLKPSALTLDEYEQVKKHPEQGVRIIAGLDFLKEVEPIILLHHERFDGKGYPRGLKGGQIDLLARIVSLIDAFEAMTAERVYASPLTLEETKNEIIKGRGEQFDPRDSRCLFVYS